MGKEPYYLLVGIKDDDTGSEKVIKLYLTIDQRMQLRHKKQNMRYTLTALADDREEIVSGRAF
jgi:hypothetical protein